MYSRGTITYNDGLVTDNAHSWYGAFSTEALLVYLKPKMEEITGKTLLPTYSYSRIYWKNSFMKKHTDRDQSEYACSLNLSNDPAPWSLNLTDLKGNDVSVLLNPGDGVVYQGWKVEHWREPYEGDQQVNAFLFWVDANGKFADEIYDGRIMLGAPGNING
jgi:hypothetical protein